MPKRRPRTRKRSHGTPWLLRAVLGLVVAACVLGLFEVGLRLGGVAPAYAEFHLGLWQTSGAMSNRRIQGNKEPHDFVLNTNIDGLRTTTERVRTEGVRRVAVMGDSNVFGWGVGEDGTFAAAAERAMQAGAVGPVEVINAGQPGYSSAQISWFFERIVARYQPDLTVVFISLHDFNLTLISDTESRFGAQSMKAQVRVGLARHSRIYEVLRRQLFPLSHRVQVQPLDPVREPRVPRVSDLERMQILDDMRQLASTWGGDVTVGLLPYYADFTRTPVNQRVPREGSGWAEQYATSRDLSLIDLRWICEDCDADELVFPYDKGHMNEAGNAVIGQALAERLLALLGG